jgi:hypothetical protein
VCGIPGCRFSGDPVVPVVEKIHEFSLPQRWSNVPVNADVVATLVERSVNADVVVNAYANEALSRMASLLILNWG